MTELRRTRITLLTLVMGPLLLVYSVAIPLAADTPPNGIQATTEEFATDSREVWDFRRHVDALFRRKDFDALEKIADEARTGRTRFANGEIVLYHFYKGLAKQKKLPLHIAEKRAAVLEEWEAAMPQSVTPKVALVDMYSKIAWAHRGSGYASSVTDKGRQNFRRYLQQSLKKTEEANQLPVSDPHLFARAIWTVLGLGYGHDAVYSTLHSCLEIDNSYESCFDSFAPTILPRWGGKPGEVERFADWAAKETGNEEAYARVTWRVADYVGKKKFADFQFSWERTRKGLSQFLSRYPTNFRVMNVYAQLAWLYNDRESARWAFNAMGQLWNEDSKGVWASLDQYHRAKSWALTEAANPEDSR